MLSAVFSWSQRTSASSFERPEPQPTAIAERNVTTDTAARARNTTITCLRRLERWSLADVSAVADREVKYARRGREAVAARTRHLDPGAEQGDLSPHAGDGLDRQVEIVGACGVHVVCALARLGRAAD